MAILAKSLPPPAAFCVLVCSPHMPPFQKVLGKVYRHVCPSSNRGIGAAATLAVAIPEEAPVETAVVTGAAGRSASPREYLVRMMPWHYRQHQSRWPGRRRQKQTSCRPSCCRRSGQRPHDRLLDGDPGEVVEDGVGQGGEGEFAMADELHQGVFHAFEHVGNEAFGLRA